MKKYKELIIVIIYFIIITVIAINVKAGTLYELCGNKDSIYAYVDDNEIKIYKNDSTYVYKNIKYIEKTEITEKIEDKENTTSILVIGVLNVLVIFLIILLANKH